MNLFQPFVTNLYHAESLIKIRRRLGDGVCLEIQSNDVFKTVTKQKH